MKRAFSLFEISIVLLVISILLIGIISSTRLIRESKLKSARALSESSQISGFGGMILWLDATAENVLTNSNDSYKLNDNDTIKTWKDLNPTNKRFTFSEAFSGGGPVYKKNGINNLPTLSFQSTTSGEGSQAGDCLYVPYNTNLNPAQLTMFVVTNVTLQTNANSWGAVVSSQKNVTGSSTGGFIFYKSTWSANQNLVEFDTGNGTTWNYMYSGSANLVINKPAIISLKLTGPTSPNYAYSYINGALNLSSSNFTYVVNNGVSDNSGWFSIGCWSSSSRFYTGQISEIILYDRVLTTDEQKAVEKYLSQKYAIKLS